MEKMLVNTNYPHRKFWAARVGSTGSTVVVRWGRIGTFGQTQVKKFESNRAAVAFFWKKVDEKRGRGYTELMAA